MFSLLRKCQSIFQSGSFYSYQQYMKITVVSHPSQHLSLSFMHACMFINVCVYIYIYFSHSNRCMVVYYGGFNLHFLNG